MRKNIQYKCGVFIGESFDRFRSVEYPMRIRSIMNSTFKVSIERVAQKAAQ